MKKTYMKPTTTVVKIVMTQPMLTTSISVGDSVTTAEGAEAPQFNWDLDWGTDE